MDELPYGSGGAQIARATEGSAESVGIAIQTEAPAATEAHADDTPRAVITTMTVGAPTELTKVIANGHTNGHAANGNGKAANGSGVGTISLSLGSQNVAFKVQEDAPSCADCGSIMVRNGSCYKCLNCGSTSGCS